MATTMKKKHFTLNLFRKRFTLSIIGILFVIAGWEALSISLSGTLPSSHDLFLKSLEILSQSEIWIHAGHSLSRVLSGWLLALFIAILVACLFNLSPQLEALFRLPINIASSIPPIAWTPISLIWFGIGNPTAIFVVFLGCFFPIFISFSAALQTIKKSYLETAAMFNASTMMKLKHVIYPAALPQLMTGLKTALAVGWFNVIAAELVGVSSGLGYQLQINRVLLFVDNVIIIMLVIGTIGWCMSRLLNTIECYLIPWQHPNLESRKKVQHETIKNYKEETKSHLKDHIKNSQASSVIKEKPSELLSIKALKSYPPQKCSESSSPIINNLSININQGDIISVIGPNGCGKSTLLRIIAGLHTEFTGDIQVAGQTLKGTHVDRSMVFQDYALYPWMTVIDNLLFACNASGRTPSVPPFKILQQLQLHEFAYYYPQQLSGGMQQKLAIARNILTSPQILLLDEPFSAYDATSRLFMRERMRQLISENINSTIIMVTHDIDEAIYMGDKVLVMDKRSHNQHEIIPTKLPKDRNLDIMADQRFLELRTHLITALNKKCGFNYDEDSIQP